MDLLIVGAGLSSAVIANNAAKKDKKVLILEKRDTIAGNILDATKKGITSHIYGPHIFHTNSEKVNNYMNQFWELNTFKNIVKGEINGKLVPIPFNFTGVDTFWPEKALEIKKKLVDSYGENNRVSILELMKQDDEILKEVAKFVYENVFLNYTVKMWGKKPDEINKSVMSRVPIVVGYGERYFSDKYEGIPKKGYTNTITKMLEHNNIEIRLNQDASKLLKKVGNKIFFEGTEVKCPIVYAGPLDELFQYKHGILDYRSLKITFETLEIERYQTSAVVNYPAHPYMTRITEFKNMTFENAAHTIISKEFPGKYIKDDKEFGIPFYPNPTIESRKEYEKYKKMVSKFENLYPIGRLATYKYLNMDQAVEDALDLANKILE